MRRYSENTWVFSKNEGDWIWFLFFFFLFIWFFVFSLKTYLWFSGKWSLEEVENLRKTRAAQFDKWAVEPEGVEKPIPTSPHSLKFKYAQAKYRSLVPAPEPKPGDLSGSSALSSTQAAEGTLRSFTSVSKKTKVSGTRTPSTLGTSSPGRASFIANDKKKKGILCEGVLEMKGEEWKKYYVTVKKNRTLQYRDLENRYFFFFFFFLFSSS